MLTLKIILLTAGLLLIAVGGFALTLLGKKEGSQSIGGCCTTTSDALSKKGVSCIANEDPIQRPKTSIKHLVGNLSLADDE